MVKVWLPPHGTVVAPFGLIEPLAPAEALMVYGPRAANVALIVWLACTLLKVKLVIAPCDTPSTSTLATAKQALGTMLKVWLAPQFTLTAPLGLIEPPAPAEALIVKVLIAYETLIVWLAWTLVK